MSPVPKKQPTSIDGEQKVPALWAKMGIEPGEYQLALHSNFEMFMRPGWPWRVRYCGGLFRHSFGYNRELAVRLANGILQPLWPGGLTKLIVDHGRECYRLAGILKLNEEQEQSLRIEVAYRRRILASIEEDDGAMVRCRLNGRTAAERDRAARAIIDQYLTFAESVERRLVTPLPELTPAERIRLHDSSVMFVLAHPRPANAKALNRKTDDVAGSLLHPPLNSPESAIPDLFIAALQKALREHKLSCDIDALARDAEVAACFVSMKHATQSAHEATERFKAIVKRGVLRLQGHLFDDEENAQVWGEASSTSATVPLRTAPPRIDRSEKTNSSESRPAANPVLLGRTIEALEKYSPEVDDGLAVAIIRKCRINDPDATDNAIVAAVEEVGKAMPADVEKPNGYLRTAVPNKFGGVAGTRKKAGMRVIGTCYFCRQPILERDPKQKYGGREVHRVCYEKAEAEAIAHLKKTEGARA